VLGPLTPLAHVGPDQWDTVVAVNVTANWRLIRSLDPLLRAAEAGRVVFVSSGAGHAAHLKPYLGAICGDQGRARRARPHLCGGNDEYFSRESHDRRSGPLRTKMRAAAMPGEDPMSLRTPEELAPKILALCAPEWTQTGMLYDFPTDRVLSFMPPI